MDTPVPRLELDGAHGDSGDIDPHSMDQSPFANVDKSPVQKQIDTQLYFKKEDTECGPLKKEKSKSMMKDLVKARAGVDH